MSRDRKILLAAGIFVLLTFIFGYAGLYSRLTRDPYYDLKQECYYIVDHAQLWYSRRLKYNGGDGSFNELDFNRIGVSDQPNSVTWNGKHGFYTVSELYGVRFSLLARAPDGNEFEVRDIYFDTRPVVEKR